MWWNQNKSSQLASFFWHFKDHCQIMGWGGFRKHLSPITIQPQEQMSLDIALGTPDTEESQQRQNKETE